MDAEFKEVVGDERARAVQEHGCCGRCGFMESGLVAFEQGRGVEVRCVECLPYQLGRNTRKAERAVWMPELSVPAFSHYVRALSFMTFAALVDGMAGYDFREGGLPEAFRNADGWTAPLRWKSLAEGLGDREADAGSRQALLDAKEAYGFVAARLRHTLSVWGDAKYGELLSSLPVAELERDYRIVDEEPDLGRIRSWGEPGSTFRIAGRTR